MRRFFISQHPTFGSYANPIKNRIEKSPYFFWFLALTLNEDYIVYCTNPSANRFETNETIKHVYNDFGDVRYEGDLHIAFTKWWRSKVNETETRGEYLFAEPISISKVMLIDAKDTAIEALEDESSLLIRIPKNIRRKQIDIAIDRIFAKELEFERGRQVRNPNRSNARYSLTKPIKIENLKASFDVYQIQRLAQTNGEKVDNKKLAKAIGLKVERRVKDEAYDAAYQSRIVSVAISRKKKLAIDAIANVVNGIFV